MACRSCRNRLDLFPRLQSLSALEAGERHALHITRRAVPIQTRRLHATPLRRNETSDGFLPKVQKWLVQPVADRLQNTARKTTHSYMVYGATEHMYKACSAQADYTITEADRKAGKIRQLEDGEEVGVGSGMWHDGKGPLKIEPRCMNEQNRIPPADHTYHSTLLDFKLLPTFSTWSQVTMLHMYLLVVRLRCLERESFQTWQSQLVDHFFHEAETKMEVAHDISSRGLRQRYLKDLFVQWRGLMLAYDEGLVRGDAVLASALWRNLFKGREDVDMRVLAAVVSWMRLSLRNLDQMQDEVYVTNAASAFKWPAKSELALVDRPSRALKGVYGEATSGKEKASSS